MPAPSTVQGPPGIRAELIAELVAVRESVVGPDGTDPALSRPLSLEDDAIEMCGVVYALPDQFRERGRSGTPLMWPWPDLFQSGMLRRNELLLGAAMLLIAAERIDRSQSPEAARHSHVVDTAAGAIWTEMTDRTSQ